MELETREEEVEQDSFRAIGAELAAARLERGMQIQELAQLLRISKHHLKNIETGDFDLLPGATYVSGYLRTYAREVGLDPVALPQRYRALLDDSEAKPAYSFPVDKQQPQRSGAMMASIMVIFAVSGYGGWYVAGKPDIMAALFGDVPQETVAIPQVENAVIEPDNLMVRDTEQGADGTTDTAVAADDGTAPATVAADETGAGEAGLAGADAAETGADDQIAVPAVETVVSDSAAELAALSDDAPSGSAAADSGAAPVDGLTNNVPAVAGANDLASSATSPALAPAVATGSDENQSGRLSTELAAATTRVPEAAPPQESGGDVAIPGAAYARQRVPEMEITVRATGISWVEIIRNDGEEVMTKLMREGEIYVVDSRDRLYLSTGNAGGIELLFHDGMVQSVGESGEILRDLPLDADRLRNQL